MTSELALLGGKTAVTDAPADLFDWPIVTAEDEGAVLDVLRQGTMSGDDITRLFESDMAEYFGTEFAIGTCNGTASLLDAMWACGVRRGTEIIGPSLSYWAAVMPAWSLGAGIVFADIDPDTLCIDPADIEHRITDRTRAIVVVHNYGYPCDMDEIVSIARAHDLRVVEDVSHGQGGLYKGRKLGTIGDVGCMSLMTGKSLPIGEGGMLITSDRQIWERVIAFAFYGRTGGSRYTDSDARITDPELAPLRGLPLGGVKHRMNQTCAAMGRVQLRHYPDRMDEIDRAMTLFWDLVEGVPGIGAHRVPRDTGSTMAGWYCPVGHYRPEELGGLPCTRFAQAVRAEQSPVECWVNKPLHLHPVFQDADVYGDGRPTAAAHAPAGTHEIQRAGSLPCTEAAPGRVIRVPWFKRHLPDVIQQHADAIRKVAEHADELLEVDP